MSSGYLLVLGTLLLVPLSLCIGAASFEGGTDTLWLLAVSRLPRTAAALLAGAGLAVAGIIMQMLVRNRFVEPATIGTGQAASLGLVAVTLFAPYAALWVKMLVAALAALTATGAFLAGARNLPNRDPMMVPLAGIVYGGVLGAVAGFIAYENDLLQYIEVWVSGEFSGVMLGRYEFLWFAAAATLVAYAFADRFTIAGLGEDFSRSFGLSYRQTVAIGLSIVSVITAVTVVSVGMLPFVGIVVPNIVSRLRGDNLRGSLPFIACLGGFLVLVCDVVGRVIWYPYEVPVGAILGIIGAAIFIWMLQGRGIHAT